MLVGSCAVHWRQMGETDVVNIVIEWPAVALQIDG